MLTENLTKEQINNFLKKYFNMDLNAFKASIKKEQTMTYGYLVSIIGDGDYMDSYIADYLVNNMDWS